MYDFFTLQNINCRKIFYPFRILIATQRKICPPCPYSLKDVNTLYEKIAVIVVRFLHPTLQKNNPLPDSQVMVGFSGFLGLPLNTI